MTDRTIDIRRGSERFHTRAGWLDSRHSFSFGHHHAPNNTHHGLLLVNNDDRVAGRTGFDTHPHRDMEIVTWVLEGRLEHKDTLGNTGELYPGLAQRMSAGRGISHSEKNPGHDPVHLVQMWVLPDARGIDPSYEQIDINPELAKGGLVPIASGRGHDDAAITIAQRNATLWGGRLGPGEAVRLPDDLHVHLFLPIGSGVLDAAGDLQQGDAVRLAEAGDPTFVAGAAGAEVLVWATA